MSRLTNLSLLCIYSTEDSIVVDTSLPLNTEDTDWGAMFTLDLDGMRLLDKSSSRSISHSSLANFYGTIFTFDSSLEYTLPSFIRNTCETINIVEPWLLKKNLGDVEKFLFEYIKWEETPTHYELVLPKEGTMYHRSSMNYTPYLPVGSKVPKVLFEEHKTVLAKLFLLLSCPSYIKAIYWGSATSTLGPGLYKSRDLILDWFSIEVPNLKFFQLPYPSIKIPSASDRDICRAIYKYTTPYLVSELLNIIYLLEKTRFCMLGIHIDPTLVQGATQDNLEKLRLFSDGVGKKTVKVKNKPHALPSQDLYSLGLVLCILDYLKEYSSTKLDFYDNLSFSRHKDSGFGHTDKDFSNLLSSLLNEPSRTMNTAASFEKVRKDMQPCCIYLPNLLKRWALILVKRSSKLKIPGAKAFPRLSFESRGFYKLLVDAKNLEFPEVYSALNSLANIYYLKHYSQAITESLDYSSNSNRDFHGYSHIARAMFRQVILDSMEGEYLSFLHSNIKSNFTSCVFHISDSKIEPGYKYIMNRFYTLHSNYSITSRGLHKIINGCNSFYKTKHPNLLYISGSGVLDAIDMYQVYTTLLRTLLDRLSVESKLYNIIHFTYDEASTSTTNYSDKYCDYLNKRADGCFAEMSPASLKFISIEDVTLLDLYMMWQTSMSPTSDPLVYSSMYKLLRSILPRIQPLLEAHSIEWDLYMYYIVQESLCFLDSWIIELQDLGPDNT